VEIKGGNGWLGQRGDSGRVGRVRTMALDQSRVRCYGYRLSQGVEAVFASDLRERVDPVTPSPGSCDGVEKEHV
jgi:hypothetical protein